MPLRTDFTRRGTTDPTTGLQKAFQGAGSILDTIASEHLAKKKQEDLLKQQAFANELAKSAENRASEAHAIELAKHRAGGLLYDTMPYTETERVESVLTPQQQQQIQLLSRQAMQQPSPVVQSKQPIAPSETKITIPVDTQATTPSFVGKNEEYAGTLADTGRDAAFTKMAEDQPWNDFLDYIKTGKEPEQPKQISLDLGTRKPAVSAVEKTTVEKPERITTDLKAIQKEIDAIKKAPAGKRTIKSVVNAKVDERAIYQGLLGQYEKIYGRQPTEFDKAAIGARAEKEATNIRTAQAERSKTDLERRKTEANINYMQAMAKAALTPKSSSAYKEAQKAKAKNKENWSKVRTNLVKMDIGDADTAQGNRYLNLLESLNLPAELGNSILASVENQKWLGVIGGRSVTPETINMSSGGIQAIDPLNNQWYPLGDAIEKADKEGWRLTVNPTSGSLELLRPLPLSKK
ncbi:MAG: hypothetical protein PVF17_02795 [Ignavibacteria bacterium]|jgi:hypothetical protein